VLAAAHLLVDFKECKGIELIDGMAKVGQGLVTEFNSSCRIHDGTTELLQGDFLTHDWSDADVVFSNASLFPKDLLKAIANKLDEELKVGARVIFITNALPVKHTKRLRQTNARRLYCKHQEEGDTPATFFHYKVVEAAPEVEAPAAATE